MGENILVELDLSDEAASTCATVTSSDSQKTKNEKISAHANALALWLLAHHFPSRIRKYSGDGEISARLSSTRGRIELLVVPSSSSTFLRDEWIKAARSSLKKIKVDDLGYMNATELVSTIPATDGEGRGLSDLQFTERKLLVKVVFDDVTGHVYLVGDAKKLEKKCFVLRNLLSHYYWRLSGNDVAFSKN